MEIDSEDDILRRVAGGGTLDYSSWPTLLPVVVSRIEKIATSEFPIPNLPPLHLPNVPPPPRFLTPLPSSDPIEPPDSSDTPSSSSETNKENTNPVGGASAKLNTSSAPLQSSSTSVAPPGASLPAGFSLPPQGEPGSSALPPQLSSLLAEIADTLTTGFPTHPPHTLQRLVELVLAPRQHYRTLAAYLHALDRVVHVTSGADVYPLPPAVADMPGMLSSMPLVNGIRGASPSGSSGVGSPSARQSAAGSSGDAGAMDTSDDTLGGAILTPIPWLTRRLDGTNGGGGGEDEDDEMENSEEMDELPAGTALQTQGAGQQQQAQRAGQGQGQPQTRKMEPQVRTEHTETIDGPNGMGSIETVSVSVNGIPSMGMGVGVTALQRTVTQGEVLRQEQEAGVVPISQLARNNGAAAGANGDAAAGGAHEEGGSGDDAAGDAHDQPQDEPQAMEEDEEEIPHARGPEEIGAADTGPQNATSSFMMAGSGGMQMHGIDVEAAVGRRVKSLHQQDSHMAGEEEEQSEEKDQQEEEKDKDGQSSSDGHTQALSKREADEQLDDSIAKKRLKEDEADVGEGDAEAERDVVMASEAAATERPVESSEGKSGDGDGAKEEEQDMTAGDAG